MMSDIEKFLSVAIFKMATTIPHKFNIVISINSEFNVVLVYNFKIIYYGKHFENTQVKHTTKQDMIII
jgi:hypothetical protein